MQRFVLIFIGLLLLGHEGTVQGSIPLPYTPPPKPATIYSEICFTLQEKIPLFHGCESSDSSYADQKRCADQKLLDFVYSNVCYPKLA